MNCGECRHYEGNKLLDRGTDEEPDLIPYCTHYPHGIPEIVRGALLDHCVMFEPVWRDPGPYAEAVIDGVHYSTAWGKLIYQWTYESLYMTEKKRLFLYHHGSNKLARIEPIGYDDAVKLLKSRGQSAAIDLIFEQDN
ncbi:hypothetical protein ACFL6U_26990 [Planctomycetota bacterium]